MNTRLAVLLLLAVSLSAGEATVTVSGEALELNGATTIPRGMFGIHNSPLTDAEADERGVDSVRTINLNPGKPVVPTGAKEQIDDKGRRKVVGLPKDADPLIDCLYDRYQPALQLVHQDWRERLTALGKSYAEQARASGRRTHLEFWNEPYLNWATQPGVNYLAPYYQDDAVAGGPMHLRTTGEAVPELVWDRQIWAAVNPANGIIDAVSTGRIPADGKAGQTVKLRYRPESILLQEGLVHEFPPFGKRELKRVWIGKDTTQKHYWSGTFNRRLYLEMYQTFATALKAENPEVEVAAGWGLNLYNEGWDAWHLLYQPTIDALHPLMDGLHEHHYGGDTRLVAASYDMAWAYALTRHGKRLRFWNTEAGGHLDPEQPGNIKPANEGTPLTRATAAATYLLRDTIHLLAFSPDKAFCRAAHHPHENGGDFIALRMLKPLRGRLMASGSDDASLWSVASLDGDRLAVALFNDRREAREVRLAVQAPPGATLAAAVRLGAKPGERTRADGQSEAVLVFDEAPLALVAGERWQGGLAMPGTSAAVVVFTLAGTPAPVARRWRQFPAPEILVPLPVGTAAGAGIAVPAPALVQVPAARLRLALSSTAGLRCTLNGQPVALPTDAVWTMEVAVPPALLQAQNRLELTSVDKPGLLVTASLLLQQP